MPFLFLQKALLGGKKLSEVLAQAQSLYSDNYIKLTDTKATTVADGASIAGTQTREINTEDSDTGNHVKIAYAIPYDAQTANFTIGGTLTGATLGGTGTIVADEDSGATGILYVVDISGSFQDNETITDSTGSATTNIPTPILGKGFYLASGTYRFSAIASAYVADQHKLILHNINDSSNQIVGLPAIAPLASLSGNEASILGELTIASNKTFKLNHYITTAGGVNGLGVPTSDGSSEIYVVIELWKVK